MRLTSRISALRWLALVVALAAITFAAHADEPAERELAAAMKAKDFTRAEELVRRQIDAEPKSFVHLYNLACVLGLSGRIEPGFDALEQAVAAGMVDRQRLERDSDLASLRASSRYSALLADWPSVLLRHRDANLAGAKAEFTRGTYIHTRDNRLRVDVFSAMDERSTAAARDQLALLYDWAADGVFPELSDAANLINDAWVVVVLPSPADFQHWAARVGGRSQAGVNTIGGAYFHDEKRLISQDLGPSLRHEFFHVLHWRSTTRLGQDHPIWIQEGLCSLVEDIEGDTPATLRPVASWRSNIAKRLLPTGRLLRIEQLAATPRRIFTTDRPLAHYAQARTLLLYVADKGQLATWYATYTAGFDARNVSSTRGDLAIAAALGLPLADVERDYRKWLDALPEVAEQLKPGEATIGVDVDPGTGDGPVVAAVPRLLPSGETSPAFRAGMQKGDVILAVDGRATADLNELLRILGAKAVGEEVAVTLRRGVQRLTLTVRLVPRRD